MTPLLTGVFASQISGHLNTFSPTGSYDALATYTVPSGGVSSVTFSGLPTGGQYTHLQVRYIARNTDGTNSGVANLVAKINGDTTYTNYRTHLLTGNGSAASASTIQTTDFFVAAGVEIANGATASMFGAGVLDILDYASSSKYKTFRTLTGGDTNGGGQVRLASSLWMNTNPINSITIQDAEVNIGVNLAQNTQISLYGVKG